MEENNLIDATPPRNGETKILLYKKSMDPSLKRTKSDGNGKLW